MAAKGVEGALEMLAFNSVVLDSLHSWPHKTVDCQGYTFNSVVLDSVTGTLDPLARPGFNFQFCCFRFPEEVFWAIVAGKISVFQFCCFRFVRA